MNSKCLFFAKVTAMFTLFFSCAAFAGSHQIETTPLNKADFSTLSKNFNSFEVVSFDAATVHQLVTSTSYTDHLRLKLSEELSLEMMLFAHDIRANHFKCRVSGSNGIYEHPRQENITYKGYVLGNGGGEVRFSITEEYIMGSFTVSGEDYFIEPVKTFQKSAASNHFVYYKTTDAILNVEATCGYEHEKKMENYLNEVAESYKSSKEKSLICRTMELAVAADESMYNKTGSINALSNYIITYVNLVDGNYTSAWFTDDIEFLIVEQFLSTCSGCDPWTSSTDASVLLSDFSGWGNAGFSVGFDIGQLISDRDFDGSTVGLAWTPGACTTNSKFNVIQDFSTNIQAIRVVAAHEIGHNLSAPHNSPASGDIMDPSVTLTNSWSTGTTGSIDFYISSGAGSCIAACSGLNACQEQYVTGINIVNVSGTTVTIGYTNQGNTVRGLIFPEGTTGGTNLETSNSGTLNFTNLNCNRTYVVQLSNTGCPGLGPVTTFMLNTLGLGLISTDFVNCGGGSYDLTVTIDPGDNTAGSPFTVDFGGNIFNNTFSGSNPQVITIPGQLADGTSGIPLIITAGDCVINTTFDAPRPECDCSVIHFEDFNNCTLPSGWTNVAQGTNPGGVWQFDTNPALPQGGFQTQGSIDGTCMANWDDDEEDHNGSQGELANGTERMILTSPAIDITGYNGVDLEFDYNFRTEPQIGNPSSFEVEVFNGSTWVNVLTETTTNCGEWTTCTYPHATINVDPFSNTNFQVRFIFDDGGFWDWHIGVDNFSLCGFLNCTDGDNDGFCVDVDCDDSDNQIGTVGSPCDDGNPITTNDMIDANCNCEGTFNCSITSATIAQSTCDENGNITIVITVNGNGVSYTTSDGFGPFAYDTPHVMTVVPGNGGTYGPITVFDSGGDPACSLETNTINLTNCGGACTISSASIAQSDCDANGNVTVTITVSGNGTSYFADGMGPFTYGSTEVFDVVSGDGSTFGPLTIVDDADPNCTAQTNSFTLTDCTPNCDITGATLTQTGCDNDGNVDVIIEVTGTGTSYTANGLGPFPYGSAQLLDTVTGDGSSYGPILIEDVNDPNCNFTINAITLETCSFVMCLITSVDIEHSECDANGNVTITAIVEGNGSSYTIGGFGPFGYGANQVLTTVAGDGSTFGPLFVVDEDDPNCTAESAQITLPDCSLCPDAGTVCDDGDPCTENDVEDGNCNCSGTPIEVDCEGVCGGNALEGSACDDGDPETQNDVYDADCNCMGTTPCNIVSIEISHTDCSGSDDLVDVTIIVTATGGGANYSVDLGGDGTFSSLNFDDNNILGSFRADGRTLVGTIITAAGCSETFELELPVCEPPVECNFTTDTSLSECFNNNTPTDSSDDFYVITLSTLLEGNSGTYNLYFNNLDGELIGNFAIGEEVEVSLQLADANALLVIEVLLENGVCTEIIALPSLTSCSEDEECHPEDDAGECTLSLVGVYKRLDILAVPPTEVVVANYTAPPTVNTPGYVAGFILCEDPDCNIIVEFSTTGMWTNDGTYDYSPETYFVAPVIFDPNDPSPDNPCFHIGPIAEQELEFLPPANCLDFIVQASVECLDDGSGGFEIILTISGGDAGENGYQVTAGFDGGYSGSQAGSFIDGPFPFEMAENGFEYTVSIADHPDCLQTVVQNTVSCTPTAIELLSFSAEAVQAGNQILWKTASEHNNDYFEILKSFNGIDFESMAQIDGQGNFNQEHSYNFLDRQPALITYYQLKQYDTDGSFSLSEIIAVNRESTFIGWSIQPIPVSDILQLDFDREVTAQIGIYNLNGQSVRSIQNNTPIESVTLNVADLPLGIYMLQLIVDGKVTAKKFVKE